MEIIHDYNDFQMQTEQLFFFFIPNYGSKLTWIFDPLSVSRETVMSPGWDNRVSSRLLSFRKLFNLHSQ